VGGGGGRNLSVTTIYQSQPSKISAGGIFEATVSEGGTQLLFVLDDNGKIQGLTLSSIRDGSPEIMEAGSRSTALALLLLSPGILTGDSDQLEQRITSLTALPKFDTLTAFLETRLSERSLQELLDTPEYASRFDSLTTAIIAEWADGDPLFSALHLRKRAFSADPQTAQFTAVFSDTASADAATLDLTNFGWRYVQVFRHGIPRSTYDPSVKSMPMGGATGLSAGSIFTLTAGGGATLADTVDFTRVAQADYYVVGPGWRSSDASLPSIVQKRLDEEGSIESYGKTALMYMVFPYLDFISGMTVYGPELVEKLNTIWGYIAATPNFTYFTAALVDWKNAGSVSDFIRASIDLTPVALGLLLSSGALVSAGIITTETAAVLSTVMEGGLALLSIVLGSANFLIASGYYFALPPVALLHTSHSEEKPGRIDLQPFGVILVAKSLTAADVQDEHTLLGCIHNTGEHTFDSLQIDCVILNEKGDSVGQGTFSPRIHRIGPDEKTVFSETIFHDGKVGEVRLNISGIESAQSDNSVLQITDPAFISVNDSWSSGDGRFRREFTLNIRLENTGTENITGTVNMECGYFDSSGNILACTYSGIMDGIAPGKNVTIGTGSGAFKVVNLPGDFVSYMLRGNSDLHSFQVERQAGIMRLELTDRRSYDSTIGSTDYTVYYGTVKNTGGAAVNKPGFAAFDTPEAGNPGPIAVVNRQFLLPGETGQYRFQFKKSLAINGPEPAWHFEELRGTGIRAGGRWLALKSEPVDGTPWKHTVTIGNTSPTEVRNVVLWTTGYDADDRIVSIAKRKYLKIEPGETVETITGSSSASLDPARYEWFADGFLPTGVDTSGTAR
jgi:hypothetical protein